MLGLFCVPSRSPGRKKKEGGESRPRRFHNADYLTPQIKGGGGERGGGLMKKKKGEIKLFLCSYRPLVGGRCEGRRRWTPGRPHHLLYLCGKKRKEKKKLESGL